MSDAYHYKKVKHEGSVQHIGTERTKTVLTTQEVIVEDDGTVRITESTHHVPSRRTTITHQEELDGEEGAEEAQHRIDEMFYRWCND